MWFDFHNKVIYQHLFKTGGHSIYQTLGNLRHKDQDILDTWVNNKNYVTPYNVMPVDIGNSHITFDHFNAIWPKINYNEYWKFAFVRNTYEVLVSGYKYSMQESYFKNIPEENNLRYEAAKKETFRRYVIDCWGHDHTQWDFLTFKEKLIVDFIGRFENLQEDFDKVCKHIGLPQTQLPKLNTSDTHKYILPEVTEKANLHYSQWYTDEILEFVNKKAKTEIDYFGFKFDDRR